MNEYRGYLPGLTGSCFKIEAIVVLIQLCGKSKLTGLLFGPIPMF